MRPIEFVSCRLNAVNVRLTRYLVALVSVVLVATSCAPKESAPAANRNDDSSAASQETGRDVKPPGVANPNLTARVGLILATNSRTWAKLLNSPAGAGVVVLFVQPDGPSANSGLGVGDVITQVDDESVTNADRTVVALRSRPGQRRTIHFRKVGADGDAKTTTITARVPGPVSKKRLYQPLIDKNPNDPVARFLIAQDVNLALPAAEAVKSIDTAIAELDKSIEIEPSFVEARSLRAVYKWNKARLDKTQTPEAAEELRDAALDEWNLAIRLDPKNAAVLVSRGQALVATTARSAKRDADKARATDTTLPRAHFVVGLAEYRLGHYGAAAKPFKTAIDLDPYNYQYYRMLTLTFMRLSRKADAQKTVDAIIDLVDNAAAREALLRIVQSPPATTNEEQSEGPSAGDS